MRIRLTLTSCAVVLALSITGSGRADVKGELEKEFDKYIKAYLNHDLKAIEAMCTPDFTEKMGGKVYNRKQALDMMKQEFASMPKGGTATIKVEKVTPKGNTAIAEASGMFKNKVKGQDGKMHEMVGSGKSRETFVKTAAGWKVKMVEELTMTMTMDGKPFDPSKMAPPKTAPAHPGKKPK